MGAEWQNLQQIWVIFIGEAFTWQMGTALAGGVFYAFFRSFPFWNRAKPVRIVSNDA